MNAIYDIHHLYLNYVMNVIQVSLPGVNSSRSSHQYYLSAKLIKAVLQAPQPTGLQTEPNALLP